MSSVFTTIEIKPIQDKRDHNVTAIANVTVAGKIRLTGIRIFDYGQSRQKLILPGREIKSGYNMDFFYPIGVDASVEFQQAILDEYNKTRKEHPELWNIHSEHVGTGFTK
jgi:DNA-binding cell septation regulator SpoVG